MTDPDALPLPPTSPGVLLAVSAGGVVGAEARYGLSTALPGELATVLVNVSGCLLIGALMTLGLRHRLARPFLGTGVLGGYTTFSAYAVDAVSLAAAGRWVVAVAYVAGTLLGAVGAVVLGGRLVRLVRR